MGTKENAEAEQSQKPILGSGKQKQCRIRPKYATGNDPRAQPTPPQESDNAGHGTGKHPGAQPMQSRGSENVAYGLGRDPGTQPLPPWTGPKR